MPALTQHLTRYAEPVPDWLNHCTATMPPDLRDFFRSRVVCYPGSGLDGHPVKLFGQAHAAHCFLYIDYGTTSHQLKASLNTPGQRFRGYRTLLRQDLEEKDLYAGRWTPHVTGEEMQRSRQGMIRTSPFAFLEILEREPELDESHGPGRLALLFLGADGFAAYDALFCQPSSQGAPWALVIQDHGFGGNYESFGGGGLLERIATRSSVFPEWLLVAENTTPWHGYTPEPDAPASQGGVHNTPRRLYRR